MGNLTIESYLPVRILLRNCNVLNLSDGSVSLNQVSTKPGPAHPEFPDLASGEDLREQRSVEARGPVEDRAQSMRATLGC